MVVKEVQTDPRVELSSLQKTKDELIKKLKPKEKEVRQLVEELKALNLLIVSAEKKAQSYEEAVGDFVKQRKALEEIDADVENLEELLSESSEELVKGAEANQNTAMQYASVSAQNIAVAANSQTIDQLYDLAYKTNWSEEDSKKFFELQYNIRKTANYKDEISDVFQEKVQDSYKVLQMVQERQGQQIKENYAVANQQFNPQKEQYSGNTALSDIQKNISANSFNSQNRSQNTTSSQSFQPSQTYKPNESASSSVMKQKKK